MDVERQSHLENFDNLSIQKYNSYQGNQSCGSEVFWQSNLNKGYQQFQTNCNLNEILGISFQWVKSQTTKYVMK